MGRVLSIDYGTKRTGLAVTDPLQIIATPLDTVASDQLLNYLKSYVEHETVDSFVVGVPRTLSNEESEMTQVVKRFIQELAKAFPGKKIHEIDERFTSSIAKQAMIDGGMKKKDRREKGNVDKISATLILQSFLDGMR